MHTRKHQRKGGYIYDWFSTYNRVRYRDYRHDRSYFKIQDHPFLAIMAISLILGLVAGIPLVDQTAEDGTVTQGLANVIGAGFSGTFTSIGIVIILGALIERSWKKQEQR